MPPTQTFSRFVRGHYRSNALTNTCQNFRASRRRLSRKRPGIRSNNLRTDRDFETSIESQVSSCFIVVVIFAAVAATAAAIADGFVLVPALPLRPSVSSVHARDLCRPKGIYAVPSRSQCSGLPTHGMKQQRNVLRMLLTWRWKRTGPMIFSWMGFGSSIWSDPSAGNSTTGHMKSFIDNTGNILDRKRPLGPSMNGENYESQRQDWTSQIKGDWRNCHKSPTFPAVICGGGMHSSVDAEGADEGQLR